MAWFNTEVEKYQWVFSITLSSHGPEGRSGGGDNLQFDTSLLCDYIANHLDDYDDDGKELVSIKELPYQGGLRYGGPGIAKTISISVLTDDLEKIAQEEITYDSYEHSKSDNSVKKVIIHTGEKRYLISRKDNVHFKCEVSCHMSKEVFLDAIKAFVK